MPMIFARRMTTTWVPSLIKQPFRTFSAESCQNRVSYIGTHNGKFHCDEVFACWMLKLLPDFKNHLILRTRNEDDLAKCDIVVDVGGVFDHEKKRYDHHQRFVIFWIHLTVLAPEHSANRWIRFPSYWRTTNWRRMTKRFPTKPNWAPLDWWVKLDYPYWRICWNNHCYSRSMPSTERKSFDASWNRMVIWPSMVTSWISTMICFTR